MIEKLKQMDADLQSLQAASIISPPVEEELIAGNQVDRARISTQLLGIKPLTTQLKRGGELRYKLQSRLEKQGQALWSIESLAALRGEKEIAGTASELTRCRCVSI